MHEIFMEQKFVFYWCAFPNFGKESVQLPARHRQNSWREKETKRCRRSIVYNIFILNLCVTVNYGLLILKVKYTPQAAQAHVSRKSQRWLCQWEDSSLVVSVKYQVPLLCHQQEKFHEIIPLPNSVIVQHYGALIYGKENRLQKVDLVLVLSQ